MLPAVHGRLYQIPNPGTGTQVSEGICCPFLPGTYPARHASKCLLFCHCRPPSSLFMQERLALDTVSTFPFHCFLIVQWPFKLSQSKHQSPAVDTKEKQFSGGTTMIPVHWTDFFTSPYGHARNLI